jgi:thiosulfate/3-mercaptopyruvate sulfurtransferase
MMPKEDHVRTHLSNIGVGLDKPVVCYDRTDNKFATRAAYVLKAWGFDNVKILDGGLKAWGDRPTESGESNKGSGTNFNFHFRPELVASYEDIQAITSGQVKSQIVDARLASAYNAGHIPGAINIPMPTLMTAEGTLRPVEEIKELFVEAGLALNQPVVFSCATGVGASYLHAVADDVGIPQHNIYDGSWSEYSVRSKE